MDTSDLSIEAYNAIIVTADKFHHDLTIQFGLLSDDCDTENEFLDESEALIKDWLTNWDLEEVVLDIFYDEPPSKKEFKKILNKILSNIDKVKKIPIEQRKFDF